jgi:anti-sigma B factor antagonist
MSSQPRRQRLEVKDIEDVTVARLTDRKVLEEDNIQALGEQIINLLDRARGPKLVLNFRNVEFMSSATLGMLVTVLKKVRAAGGKLVLCSIDQQILEVFAITKLDKQFVIRGDEEEALESF